MCNVRCLIRRWIGCSVEIRLCEGIGDGKTMRYDFYLIPVVLSGIICASLGSYTVCIRAEYVLLGGKDWAPILLTAKNIQIPSPGILISTQNYEKFLATDIWVRLRSPIVEHMNVPRASSEHEGKKWYSPTTVANTRHTTRRSHINLSVARNYSESFRNGCVRVPLSRLYLAAASNTRTD